MLMTNAYIISIRTSFMEWIDKQRYKIVYKTKCEHNLWDDDYQVCEYRLHFHVELYQNGFNQRKYKIVDSNYHTCWFASSERSHGFITDHVLPWVKGKDVYGLPERVKI